jgi:NAD(P)-dependent dehydrogenase (short-subunit alcohol dehydrogenase family)
MKTICVLGASGNVGNAVMRELLAAGHRIVAVSRSGDKLEKIRAAYGSTKRIEILAGDVSSDELAAKLSGSLAARFGKPDAIVASLSSHAADAPMRILDTPTERLKNVFDTNFFSHATAAKALIPSLQPRGVYVGINGGLADFVIPNRGALSMTQSALRALYSVLAQEAQSSKAQVRLLGLYGLVATDQNRAQADDGWISDHQVGERVSQIISQPDAFPGPLLALKAKRYS